jgi:hypothetical protein
MLHHWLALKKDLTLNGILFLKSYLKSKNTSYKNASELKFESKRGPKKNQFVWVEIWHFFKR